MATTHKTIPTIEDIKNINIADYIRDPKDKVKKNFDYYVAQKDYQTIIIRNNTDGAIIKGLFNEDFSVEGQATWETGYSGIFEKVLGGGDILGGVGIQTGLGIGGHAINAGSDGGMMSAIPKTGSVLTWTGSERPNFTFTFHWVQLSPDDKSVLDMSLLAFKGVYPEDLTDDAEVKKLGFVSAPNAYKANLTAGMDATTESFSGLFSSIKNKFSGKDENTQQNTTQDNTTDTYENATGIAKSLLGKMGEPLQQLTQMKGTFSIRIGNWFIMPSCVMENVNVSYDKNLVGKIGIPDSCTISITLKPVKILSYEDLVDSFYGVDGDSHKRKKSAYLDKSAGSGTGVAAFANLANSALGGLSSFI
jgi:hypothetical protein